MKFFANSFSMICAAVANLVRMYPRERHMSQLRPNLVEVVWVAHKPAAARTRCRDGFVFARKGGG